MVDSLVQNLSPGTAAVGDSTASSTFRGCVTFTFINHNAEKTLKETFKTKKFKINMKTFFSSEVETVEL